MRSNTVLLLSITCHALFLCVCSIMIMLIGFVIAVTVIIKESWGCRTLLVMLCCDVFVCLFFALLLFIDLLIIINL